MNTPRIRSLGKWIILCALPLLLVGSGCRRFGGVNTDITIGGSPFEPGTTKEVELKVTRHWDEDESFRIEFEPHPDVTVHPSSLDIKAGRVVTTKVTVEVKKDAAPGLRTVKMRTTPEVKAYGKEWTMIVGKRENSEK